MQRCLLWSIPGPLGIFVAVRGKQCAGSGLYGGEWGRTAGDPLSSKVMLNNLTAVVQCTSLADAQICGVTLMGWPI